MRRTAILASALFAAFAGFAAGLEFAVANDHANLIYKVGEEAVFTVTAIRDGKPAAEGWVDAKLDNFGPSVQLSNRVDLAKGNPFTVRGRLAEPGFLRLTLHTKDEKAKVWSVGYEPERIEKGSPSPADFDAFWSAARAKLAKEVPLDAKMTKVPERSTADFDYYRISFATFGRRVYGYMSVPTDKAKAPYPVELQVSAAGFGDWTNGMTGEKGVIKVFFSVYPWAPHWDWRALGLQSAYDYMNDACERKYGCRRYCTAGLSGSREEYFYYPVILGIDRAVDWIAARPDVDRRRFWYQGTSQGGGFGFYLTGLNRTFTRAAFFVPAIADTMGYLKGRQSGWPQPVESHCDEDRVAVERNAPYFDGANFASRVACPVRVAVGFSDTTCAPCAVYAAYNAIKVADKGIVHGFGMTHSCFGKFYKELGEWLRK
jgi:cephalosporin-C deacetylase-like acetyl esterase